MVACLLCSRTSGSAVVRGAIERCLTLWPTPSAVLAADEARWGRCWAGRLPHLRCWLLHLAGAPSGPAESQAAQQAACRPSLPCTCCSLVEELNPLGLQATRLAGVRALARDFLATDWEDPTEFKHCGPFVADSWRIFCCGSRQPAADANLARYQRWRAHGTAEEKALAKRGSGSGRKRKAEPAAEAGTLRSGRRRGSGDSAGGSSPPAERRQTRAAGGGRRG